MNFFVRKFVPESNGFIAKMVFGVFAYGERNGVVFTVCLFFF